MKIATCAVVALTIAVGSPAKADRLSDLQDQVQELQEMLIDQDIQRREDAAGAEIDRLIYSAPPTLGRPGYSAPRNDAPAITYQPKGPTPIPPVPTFEELLRGVREADRNTR